MKRLVRLAAQLYPRWWRQRYAREFEALLEELTPGWRELFDVIRGALTMQIRTLGTIPVIGALAGAIVGGIIAMRTPEVFASTATIRLNKADMSGKGSAAARDLRVSLDQALGASGGAKKATSVKMLRGESAQTTLEVTYLDPDPARAQRVAETLTAAIVTGNSGRAASTEVLDPPRTSTAPILPDYPGNVAFGGGAGLVGGIVLLALLRWRRHPASAG